MWNVESWPFISQVIVGLILGLIPSHFIHKWMANRNRKSLQDLMKLDRADIEEEKIHRHFREILDNILEGKGDTTRTSLIKPILYLQGFDREGEGRVYWKDKELGLMLPMRVQYFLTKAFSEKGAVLVGVGGKHSEVIKLKRTDAQWEQTFYQLSNWVNVIIMRPFHTPGVLKELVYLIEHFPEKLVLIMDPIDTNFDGKLTSEEIQESRFHHKKEVIDPNIVWQNIKATISENVVLPHYNISGGFVGFIRDDKRAIRVVHLPFQASAIVELVEDRGGFIQKYGKATGCFPDDAHPDANVPYYIPVYTKEFTPADVENAVHNLLSTRDWVEKIYDRPVTGDEFNQYLDKLAYLEIRFDSWLSKEEFQNTLNNHGA